MNHPHYSLVEMNRVLRFGLALSTVVFAAGCLAGPRLPLKPAGLAAQSPVVLALDDGQPNPLAAPVTLVTIAAPTPVPASSPRLLLTPTAQQQPADPTPAERTLPDAPPTATQLDEPATRVPILEYHYSTFDMLPTVTMRPEWFEAQMQWLAAAGFHSLTSAELASFVTGERATPARSVALTFDVGASHFDEYNERIIPALRRYHLRAIFFVMPSQTRDTCDGRRACWPSVLAWRDEGLISVESHSFTHEDYATLSPERLAFDVARSKAAIEARTGQSVLGLCYPFDSINPAAFDLLKTAGYKYAVAGATRRDRSAQWADPQPYALPRYYPYSGEALYPVISGAHGLTFEQMVLGAAAANFRAGD